MKRFDELSTQQLLAISYMTYLILCSIGLFLDVVFPIRAHILYGNVIGIICFIIAPALILWAQYSSGRFHISLEKKEGVNFTFGPYRYMRNPTQFALIILILGYTAIANSVALCITSLISYYISNYFYMKHEFRLEKEYDGDYAEYKSKVKKYL